ncbi:MAG TPA: IS1380 family transposase [Acetobacteraceae bacterium]|nr:IS1380 family transposase [Acetobacteraceae bacterium]
MPTECTPRLFEFEAVERRKVVAGFDGGAITSNAGALLLGQVDRGLGLVRRFAECFTDRRDARYVEHGVETLVGQRIFGLALGYEDLNDHDELRRDPTFAVLAGKLAASLRSDCEALAGKSTLNRLEHRPKRHGAKYHKIDCDGAAVDRLLVDLFLEAHERAPREIVIDLDNTDIPLHGEQEGRFFHGYYDGYCYLPLYAFCGRHLLLARQRCANVAGCEGAVEEVARIIARIRQRWPRVRIILRADSGFSNDPLMAWCEANRVDYVFGLARNRRLEAALAEPLAEAKRRCLISGKPARVFRDFHYRTIDSWSRARRVVGKAEHTPDGANPRFVVTSLARTRNPDAARALYENLYCARGEMENRIGEQFELFADRASSATLPANQLRLWFSAMAYVLVDTLRRVGLRHTRFADAAAHTIRLKLLKLGAQVRTSRRRIHFALASGCPDKAEFEIAYLYLQRAFDPGLFRSSP